MQRTAHLALRAFAIQRVCVLKNVRIYGDDAIEAPVVQSDPYQVLNDEFPRSDATLFHCGLHLGNRCFHDVEGTMLRGLRVGAGFRLALPAQIYGDRYQ